MSSRHRSRSSRRSCDCDTNELSRLCCANTGGIRHFLLIFFPVSLATMYMFAGAYRLSVFKLDTGTTKYLIAAQGYKSSGGQW